MEQKQRAKRQQPALIQASQLRPLSSTRTGNTTGLQI